MKISVGTEVIDLQTFVQIQLAGIVFTIIIPGQLEHDIEEGISYIAGNTLWAFYQFSVVIVLLSILRARMVNTYHRVFKEADVQWKYFR